MPLNRPIGLIPFFAPDACEGCPQYGDGQCHYFSPSKPIVEILTDAERIERLEKQSISQEVQVYTHQPHVHRYTKEYYPNMLSRLDALEEALDKHLKVKIKPQKEIGTTPL